MWDFMPERASSYAADIDNVIMVVTYTVGAWLIAAYVVFFLFLFLYRKKPGQPARYVPGKGKQMAWVLAPVFLVVLCDLGIDLYNAPIWSKVKQELPEVEQTVQVLGRQWSWHFTYPGPDGRLGTQDDLTTVNELHVKVDSKTRFILIAADVLHSLSIPAFRLKQDAVPGRRITGWFEAVKIGTFDIQCAEICGAGHGAMAARVIVHSAADFDEALRAAIGDAGRPPARRRTAFAEKVALAFNPREN